MTEPDAPEPQGTESRTSEPQPRDIALEQPSPELLEQLEEQSEPERPDGGSA
jgi:hypothetical protein